MKENRRLIGISIVVLLFISLCAVCATTSVTAADVSGVPAGSFVGSSQSKDHVYHYPSCGHVRTIKQGNLVTFTSVADACANGYRPCKDCNPPACQVTPTPTATPTGTPSPKVTSTPTPSVNQLAGASVTPVPSTTQATKQVPEFPLPVAGAAVVIVAGIYVALRRRL
ncbi:MAG: Ada metal-binding domain-containing protein [Halobacteriota archaeon]